MLVRKLSETCLPNQSSILVANHSVVVLGIAGAERGCANRLKVVDGVGTVHTCLAAHKRGQVVAEAHLSCLP